MHRKTNTASKMETINETTTAEPKKRISRTMRWAMAHPFMIYEVTDPELRSQLCYYRNKDKQEKEQVESIENQEILRKLNEILKE